MKHYTRISDSIRRNKNLTSTQKLILGYLQTYQSNTDGTPTNNFYYDKQDNLAEELGMSLKAITVALKGLEENKLVFQPKKGSIDGKPQYKNRKAIIMVDEFNPYPEEAITATISTQPTQDVLIEEKVSEIEAEIATLRLNKIEKEWLRMDLIPTKILDTPIDKKISKPIVDEFINLLNKNSNIPQDITDIYSFVVENNDISTLLKIHINLKKTLEHKEQENKKILKEHYKQY